MVNSIVKRRLPVISPWLSICVGVLILAGFAACLACDLDSCCDDAEHDGETFCSCACALQGLAPTDVLPLSPLHAIGSACRDDARSPDAVPLCGLYRPPRA